MSVSLSLRPAAHRSSLAPLATRWTLALAGQTIIALGVALQSRARLGVVGWDLVHAGLAGLTGLSAGQASLGVAALLVVVGRALGYRPTAMVVVAAACFGTLLDAWLQVLPYLGGDGRWVGQLLGAGLVAAGAAGYLHAGVGESAHDIPLALARARGVPLALATNVKLALTTMTGVLLGGRLGPGSLATMLVLVTTVPRLLELLDRCRPLERWASVRELHISEVTG